MPRRAAASRSPTCRCPSQVWRPCSSTSRERRCVTETRAMTTAPPRAVTPGGGAHIALTPTRSTMQASRTALRALILRDLLVLRKNFAEFLVRTLIQPFLLVFVFLYVFPSIGQGVGGGGGRAAESAFATGLVPGVIGITIMFQ